MTGGRVEATNQIIVPRLVGNQAGVPNARESTEIASINTSDCAAGNSSGALTGVIQGIGAAPGVALARVALAGVDALGLLSCDADVALANEPERCILLGDAISVADIARVDPSRLAGIVCRGGCQFSHTTIVAEALGIPAIVGLEDGGLLAAGDLVIIDGTSGRIYRNPSQELRLEYRHFLELAAQEATELEALRFKPASTRDGTAIQLLVNTGLLADARPGLSNGAEGIGLYRSEIPFLARAVYPTEEEQYDAYRQVLKMYQGKPVTMRLLDIGGDKALPYHPVNETNPGMGLRGIRFLLEHQGVLKTQLRAMLRASSGLDNLRLLLPMVSEVKEVVGTKQVLAAVVRELRQEGVSVKLPYVGVMVEVPAVVSQLELIADHVDFLSVGSNDLTSHLLAVDRQNPLVASYYDPLHPALIDMLLQIVAKAGRLRLPVTVCGEIANSEVGVVLLLSAGVRKLSIHAASVPRIKRLIRRLDLDDLIAINRQDTSSSNRASLRSRVEAYVQRRNLNRKLPEFGIARASGNKVCGRP